MSTHESKKNLINWDLVSVNPSVKNWDWKDLFYFWGVNIQSVIGFSLITSLYVVYNLNTLIVFFGTLLGSLLVYFFSYWIGLPSQKFGLPFIVLLRSSLGVKGAKYFGLIRALVGIFMFGIQTYFLSKAFVYLIRIIIFSIEPSILDYDIFLIFFLGLNIIDWISITFSILIQVSLFSIGMIFNKKIIKFSAIAVYLGIFMFFLILFLNDVKITSNAFMESVNYKNIIDQNNLLPLITVAGTVFAYFSIVILSFGDFCRYVKDKNELKKGNLSLIVNLIIFSFLALFIVTGVDAVLKQDPENLSRILTNPTDIIGKLNNLLITNMVLIFIIIASASTNLVANFIPSQYTLINFIPSSISLKGAKIGCPDTPVIGFAGDGAFGISMNEMSSCAREEWPAITMVIFRNYQWGAEKRNTTLWFDNNFIGTELDPELSYAKVADACGLKGVTVKTMEETTAAIKQSCEDQKKGITTFIEVILNQELGEPFRRDAMKKPVRVAGIKKDDMKKQPSLNS